MHRSLQFGMCENPASNRRHGSQQAAEVNSDELYTEERAHPLPQPSATDDHLFTGPGSAHPASHYAATGEREVGRGRLLTVEEVAHLLHVPVSWVYGRTRKRSLERLPGYRLGKYWRFREEDVAAWIKSQRGGSHAT
jgi:excisionase family DNA binding protein